jgi:hypothetical protein
MQVGAEDQLVLVDQYLDAAPRSDASAETVGPFILFKSNSAWSYYARPRLGADGRFSREAISRLAARCNELGLDLAIEWVAELVPSLERAADAAGLRVERHALLVSDPRTLSRAPAPEHSVGFEQSRSTKRRASLRPDHFSRWKMRRRSLPLRRYRLIVVAVSAARSPRCSFTRPDAESSAWFFSRPRAHLSSGSTNASGSGASRRMSGRSAGEAVHSHGAELPAAFRAVHA